RPVVSAPGDIEATADVDDDARRDDTSSTPSGRDTSPSARAALAVFVAVQLIALPLMLFWARGTWFQLDDWDFLATRTGGNVGDLLRPHFEHWTTLPIVAYRVMWTVFGLHTVVPYQVLIVVAHL